jgi:hypothetical protein
MLQLKQGTKVKFDYQTIQGEGEVVGISMSQPILGNMYIIKTDKIISEVYPYTTFVCPECYIKFWI